MQISNEEWKNWRSVFRRYRYNQSEYISEKNGESLESFLEYISDKYILDKPIHEYDNRIGKNIFNTFFKEDPYRNKI